MGVRSYFKNTAKANTNVTAWMGWSSVRDNAKYVKGLVDDIKPKKQSEMDAIEKETFDDAVQRFGLTEKDIEARMKSHFRVSLGCFVLALLGFAWFIHILLIGMLMSSIVALSVTLLMMTYAVTENLNYYRIKQRRLNCTLREWFFHFFGK